MKKGGLAVLDAPERDYAPKGASKVSGPRRAAGSLRRDLQEEYGRSFRDTEPDFGMDFDSDRFDPDARNGSAGKGTRWRSPGRAGAKRGFLGWLPETLWGRIWAGVGAALALGLAVGGVLAVQSALLHDERFVIPSSAAIGVEGNRHVTRAQLLSIFGGDVDRNIFTVPLSERLAELERLPWVEHATVMRLLPNHLKVSIVERTPVAFVRQGSHISLVDKNGVLMEMGSGTGYVPGHEEHYSFPVVTGISAEEPLSTRAARMRIFGRFTSELNAGGATISDGLSEVDLSNPEDVKATIPDDLGTSKAGPDTQGELVVHFGDSDFLERYKKYKAHLSEWRTQYPKLASVDMRYERQAVLEMQQGGTTVGPAASFAAKAPVAAPEVKPVDTKSAVANSAAKAPLVLPAKASPTPAKAGPAALAAAVAAAAAKNSAPAAAKGVPVPAAAAARPVVGVPSTAGAAKPTVATAAKPAPVGGSTAKPNTDNPLAGAKAGVGLIAKPGPVQRGGVVAGTASHLTVAKDVPAKKPAAKKVAAKKVTGKKPAKKVVAQRTSNPQYRPPTVIKP